MKLLLSMLMCIMITIGTLGQDQRALVNEIEVSPPAFIGVDNAAAILQGKTESIYVYLANNIVYPYVAGKNCCQGTEVIQFTILRNGNVADIEIVNSISEAIDKEVVRVLESTNGMWRPGSNNGNAVAMRKEVSVVFAIGETENLAKGKDFKFLVKRHFKKGGTKLLVDRNPQKAIRQYNKVVLYSPKDKGGLLMRGLCRYEMGDIAGAQNDWRRVKELGGLDFDKLYLGDKLDSLKGFDAMSEVLEKQVSSD